MGAPRDRGSLKSIGSVFPLLEPGEGPPTPSLWEVWAVGAQLEGFRCARAALKALLKARGVRRLWAPDYICVDALADLTESGIEIRWCEIDSRLEPDWGPARDHGVSGDAVLAVAYFGRPAGFGRLAWLRPDLLRIEDRAQALDGDGIQRADYAIYSPRKWVGVGDGGILVGRDGLPRPVEAPDADVFEPLSVACHIARSQDPDGLSPSSWHPMFQAREAALDGMPYAVSRATRSALQRWCPAVEMNRRRANWRSLQSRLGALAVLPASQPDFTPLAFPIFVPDAAKAVRALAGRGIYCARHWPRVAAASPGPVARRLSQTAVSLPLDGRYGPEDMDRICEAVLRL